MNNQRLVYEGKAKKLYETEDPATLRMHFKDDATAFDGEKYRQFDHKGEINKKLTLLLFRLLEEEGVPTHLLEDVDEVNLKVRRARVIPVEVVVRNRIAGSLSKRTGKEEGTALPRPIVEYFYKRDDLGDPMITHEHIEVLELAGKEEMDRIRRHALEVNRILRAFFSEVGIDLVDFKLEFGRAHGSEALLLVDEITPDTCRLWDADTGEKLDKDRFRRDLGDMMERYSQVLGRVERALHG